MLADSDIHVWLETMERTRPDLVVPYVRSENAQDLRFRLRAVQEGGGGRAVIGQRGAVRLQPNVPAALARLSLSRKAGDRCEIEIILVDAGMEERRYLFDCPA